VLLKLITRPAYFLAHKPEQSYMHAHAHICKHANSYAHAHTNAHTTTTTHMRVRACAHTHTHTQMQAKKERMEQELRDLDLQEQELNRRSNSFASADGSEGGKSDFSLPVPPPGLLASTSNLALQVHTIQELYVRCYAALPSTLVYAHVLMCRVGQNHIYAVHIRCFWQRNHQIYSHIHCIYTVLANPTNVAWPHASTCIPCTHTCIQKVS
jgi:hypothetical protein